jgi:NAD(P)-dependent dehydrogenase (short-subunit alcohol dehydrogenase family)
MRFQDKIAIVTGGSSGMGKEVATRFVAEGGSVVVNGRDAAKTGAAARQIDPSGKRAAAHVGDVARPATGEALVKTAVDRFGRLDVLFNNAGIFAPKPFLEVTEAEYDRFIDNILKGSFFTAQAAAKAMKAAGGAAPSCRPARCGRCRRSAPRHPQPIPRRRRASTRWSRTSLSNWHQRRSA